MDERERERERWRIAEKLTEQFANRSDIHARQLRDGRYSFINRPFTPALMYAHLKGELTLGTYLLGKDNQTKFAVLDADDEISGLKDVYENLKSMDIPSYLETSRRGGHLWLFFEEKITGKQAKDFGLSLTREHNLHLEVFPKQEQLNGGPGSLIRVPFGIHQKTGKRYAFLMPETMREQVLLLTDPDKIPVSFVVDRLQKKQASYQDNLDDLKSIPIANFIGQYVELRPVASGYIGLCPFHDDETPSFGINVNGNYWHCFADCGGGDLVSFYMKFHNVSFYVAVKELRQWMRS